MKSTRWQPTDDELEPIRKSVAEVTAYVLLERFDCDADVEEAILRVFSEGETLLTIVEDRAHSMIYNWTVGSQLDEDTRPEWWDEVDEIWRDGVCVLRRA